MKKTGIVITSVIVIVMAIAIVGLSLSLYDSKTQLSAALADIDDMTFSEGKVFETESGGIVTASLKSWIYFQDDSFITAPKEEGTSINGIFCDLHTTGFVDSMKGDLVKLKYTKQITVTSGKTQKYYYLVGDYYITFASATTK